MTPDRPALPRAKGFRTHFWVFACAFAVTLALNLGLGVGLPMFWPLAAWSVALAIHFFVASAAAVQDEWVDERALELRMRSYDFGHIDDIRDRAADRDRTVTHPLDDRPPEPRRRRR
ncbi:MAG: 2TM domain-containing protein [Alphaproteobacteria bacterium]